MNLVVAFGIVWCLGMLAYNRRAKTRDQAASYQLSDAWRARWYFAPVPGGPPGKPRVRRPRR
jgi:hypothetical protein